MPARENREPWYLGGGTIFQCIVTLDLPDEPIDEDSFSKLSLPPHNEDLPTFLASRHSARKQMARTFKRDDVYTELIHWAQLPSPPLPTTLASSEALYLVMSFPSLFLISSALSFPLLFEFHISSSMC